MNIFKGQHINHGVDYGADHGVDYGVDNGVDHGVDCPTHCMRSLYTHSVYHGQHDDNGVGDLPLVDMDVELRVLTWPTADCTNSSNHVLAVCGVERCGC